MSDLEAAAAALNAPEAIVRRSAEARAAASGVSVDEILAAWAGGGSAPAGAPAQPTATPEPAAAPEADAPADTVAAEAPAPPRAPDTPADQGAPAPAAAPAASVTRPPVPERVSPEEAVGYPVVVSVPTAGLKERTATGLPRWLVAIFMLVPAFGLLYLSGALDAGATSCEPGGLVLAVDRASGAPENCDGTPFEGRGGAAGEAGAFITAGGDLYRGAAVNCAGCHGPSGGGGSGPALTNVMVTFSSCADHVEWVQLGSAGFQAAGNTTYGDVAKPIGGGMPGFSSLSDQDLRSVVAFERISFGGAPADQTLQDCGLVEASEGGEGGEGEGTAEGSEGAVEGSGDTGEGSGTPQGGDIEGDATTDPAAPAAGDEDAEAPAAP